MLTSLCSPTCFLLSTFVLWYFVFAQRLHSTLVIMPRRVWKERCYFIFFFLIWLFLFRMEHRCSRGIRSLYFFRSFLRKRNKITFLLWWKRAISRTGKLRKLQSPPQLLCYFAFKTGQMTWQIIFVIPLFSFSTFSPVLSSTCHC